jgi:hypothetical protein
MFMQTKIRLDAIIETRLAEAPRERVFAVVWLGETSRRGDAVAYREATAQAFIHAGGFKPWFVSARGNLGVVQSDGGVVFPDQSEPDRDAEGMPIGATRTCPMCEGHLKRISIETGQRDEACSCQNGRVIA